MRVTPPDTYLHITIQKHVSVTYQNSGAEEGLSPPAPPAPGVTQHVGSEFPDQGSNPPPLQWKCRVLTTGPPGKSQGCLLYVCPFVLHAFFRESWARDSREDLERSKV